VKEWYVDATALWPVIKTAQHLCEVMGLEARCWSSTPPRGF
jgi:hypothetical protein